MNINLNDKVKVILTDKGIAQYKNWHKELFKDYPDVYMEPYKNVDKILITQFHDLMLVFGSQMYVGNDLMFENNNIEIVSQL